MSNKLNDIKYSLLKSYKDVLSEKDIESIKYLLLKGIKVIVILDENINKDIVIDDINKVLANADEFQKYNFLQIYNAKGKIEELNIIDGKSMDLIEKANIEQFNLEQYKAEHMNISDNILIQASAGTGKTTIMIDRILYLLHMDETIEFEDITMITFTNDATSNMKRKLSEKILIKYELTNNKKYLKYIESVENINIRTIHSFSKSLISKLGSIVGYGKNVELRSFKYDKDEIILGVLDKYFKEFTKLKSLNIVNEIDINLHDLKKLIHDFWISLERKGISYSDIENLDWGYSSDTESYNIQNIFIRIFKDIEDKFRQLRYSENAISIGGIVRELDEILNKEINNESKEKNILDKIGKIKYLFVDEFQDTDDTQIKLISWLYKNLNTKVFLVGDIKQSIYRFRGTNDTAFEVIKQGIKDIESISLIKNYRTSSRIIDKLNPKFSYWNKYKLLNYSEADKIVAMSNENGRYIYDKRNIPHEERVVNSFKYYQEQLQQQMDEKNISTSKKIVALVRSNYEVELIKNICERNDIKNYIESGGTFFISEAVKDFMALISVYLFPNETMHKLNYMQTPYFVSKSGIDYKLIFSEVNDKIQLNKKLYELLNNNSTYSKYKDVFRIKPVMQVIKSIIQNDNIIDNYYNEQLNKYKERYYNVQDKESIESYVKIKTKLYEGNLNKLLELIQEKFNSDFCSLYKLHEYLLINIKTNREEDEVELEEKDTIGWIRCMTVHKAKGLEFDTVILPSINKPFNIKVESEILVYKSNDKYRIGWIYKNYKNSYYDELKNKEIVELSKEETRLLYVASTRSIKNLVFIDRYETNNMRLHNICSWADLLRGV